MKIRTGGSSVTIDGRTFTGSSISIQGDRVIVDGVEQEGSMTGPITVTVNGNADSVETASGKVFVSGSAGRREDHVRRHSPSVRSPAMTILVQQLRAEIEQLQAKVVQLEKSLKLVQSHAHTAYTRGRQAGIADQERTAREAIAAMDLARDQMMDENERFTDLLEKAEQERDQLKAENAQLRSVGEQAWMALVGYLPAHQNEVTKAAIDRCMEVLGTKAKEQQT